MSFQMVVIGGIVGAFLAATIADSMVVSGTASLAPATRERVYQRIVKFDLFLRVLDIAGIILLVLGILGLLGVIRGGPQFAWRYGAVAAGFAVICLERVIRSWITWHCYNQESDAAAARGKTLSAALLVTIVEVALGAWVCWWVFNNVTYTGPRQPSNPAPAQQTPAPKTQRVWINENAALELLDKDKAYFELLVPFAGIRNRDQGGVTLYLKSDLESQLEAGLPTLEQLKDSSQKQSITPNEIAKQIKPLLDAGQRKEAVAKVRELTGWPEGQATEFVEALAPPESPALQPVEKTPEGETLKE